ncbi:alanine racemase [Segniliparus rugosus]|uniref:Alanine racemase n=1 Tax=Segniliparus rugosus (strain ATCC BAA-974 / DSM 45345 / CCUG 50838 / CIP 108380 / JCM 13579 / CDC 945) TaxID=679197 RepID=E5XQM0_SEGRC|nr:alanine racemase [Segniliparus rugosus]EFV13333.1 alanine racemase [Segniliparus rugosus ATCC BAA-974]
MVSAPAVQATVDHSALAHNVRLLIQASAPAKVIAVLKANAYGHGAVPVARTVLAAGAAQIGVATLDEAFELRAGGIEAPIIAWLHAFDPSEAVAVFAEAVALGIELGVSTSTQLRAVAEAAMRADEPAVVAVKVDTGLNRGGFAREDWRKAFADLANAEAAGAVRVRAVFSHLANADRPEYRTNAEQASGLRDAVALARKAGLSPQLVHLANSPAVLTRPRALVDGVPAFNATRPGVAVYGLSPIAGRDFGLIPAMTLTARVGLVKRIQAGDGVSYGHDFVAPTDTTLALLPIGYADGLPRSLAGKFEVVIGGRRYPGVGRVCMDQVLVDLGPGRPRVREGDIATLFGSGKDGEQTVDDWAKAAGTINYEIVTQIRGRVRLQHINV